ncbi:MAG TPA: BTAD domain-containing putative transcriptional regulator, partial [Umezawaea sp.]|nr:BTAD domain-containing putative transcriptional regulator [Umezawaea sp.]
MSTTSSLVIRLLGPVRAWRNGVEVDLGTARTRAVFTVLAMRANDAVSKDELIDGVWGDAPPATAGASLYTYISALRRALEPERSKRSAGVVLTSSGAGYALRLDREALDVHRFDRHREQAEVLARHDPERAVAELDAALALWEGEALFSVTGRFAESQRSRLHELRLAAVERRAELALLLGRHADVAADLAGLVVEHPLREGLRALLMSALHQGGRQAEALEVFRDARHVLADELGIEPGPALREAHRRVLQGDAPQRPPAAGPPPSPPTSAPRQALEPLVGRHRELGLLRRAVTDVAGGRGGVLWLEGEPGIGKSSLLEAGLAGAGARVAQAAADELGSRFPLRVVLDALDVSITSPDPRRVELAQDLLAATGDHDAAGDPVLTAIDRLVELVRELCAGAPLVLALDDFQWADEASVLLWRRLSRLAHRLSLLLIAVTRPVPHREDVARVRRLVVEAGGLVVLGPLADDEVTALVTGVVGAAPGRGLDRLAECAGGNPLYVKEVLHALLRENAVEFRAGVAEVDVDRHMPTSLVTALTRRLTFLSAEALDLLRWAALLGTAFAPGDAAVVAG